MKIEKMPSGSYRIRKMYKGQTYSVITEYKPTQKEALKLISDKMSKANIPKVTSRNFEYVFKLAVEEKRKLKSDNTYARYKADYDRYIDLDLANMNITDISYDDIKTYTLNMVKETHPKIKAYSNYKSLLNLVFNYAVEKGWMEYNIAAKLNNKDFYALCENEKKTANNKAMSPKQIEDMTNEVNRRIKSRSDTFMCGYMFLLASKTGMRAGELCALKWEDIKENYIHIHGQQLCNRVKKKLEYANWTKDEKGVSNGGRFFPLTNDIRKILADVKKAENEAKINTKWVFCNNDGSWINADTCYEKFIYRLCKSLGYTITNNHGIRMYFNSYVLIPSGIIETNRSKLLGHSVEVNIKNYSFESHDYCDVALDALQNTSNNS